MSRTASNERVQLVPGFEGPRWVATDEMVASSRAGGEVGMRLRFEYDDDQHRYVCTEFTVRRTPDANGRKGFVTSETLRQPAVADLTSDTLWAFHWDGTIRELPNPDDVEPWGFTPPADLVKEGPTDRVLQWVAHLYHYGMVLSFKPAKVVEERLELSHGTAARWVRLARQKGYLGPSEGPGRPAG